MQNVQRINFSYIHTRTYTVSSIYCIYRKGYVLYVYLKNEQENT